MPMAKETLKAVDTAKVKNNFPRKMENLMCQEISRMDEIYKEIL